MTELFKQVIVDGVECLFIDRYAFNVAQSIREAKDLDEAAERVRNVLNNVRQQLAQQSSLQAQINTLNDAITEDKILVAYTKQIESSNNLLVEALRQILNGWNSEVLDAEDAMYKIYAEMQAYQAKGAHR